MFAETKSDVNKFNIHVSFLFICSLHVIVICQKYFGITVTSSQILLFAPSLVMRHCTLWISLLALISKTRPINIFIVDRNEMRILISFFYVFVNRYDKLKPYGFPIHGCIDGYVNWLIKHLSFFINIHVWTEDKLICWPSRVKRVNLDFSGWKDFKALVMPQRKGHG